ncbi:hypothetical protein [Paenibacillus dakarensis]|uniref:hypothetical protein n=1 Tax=Paenibacillus dakarensis TaxID=1527293 RepID=UPI0006D5691A|nr:hypothetical protein [Paenibacillus dakarensis]
MTDKNETNSNQEDLAEQKNQFRNFVEGVTGGGNGYDPGISEKSRVADEQNRLIDQHNLRK